MPGEFAFYSDDVVRGQFLNFSNMLTLGPAFYQGGVITIDVDEIRLAGTTEHIKDTLKQLADSKMDVVGPDPEKRRNWNAVARDIFDVIDKDAYGTRYTLTLMPSGGVAELPYPRFEAGNYVLVRHEAPNANFSWNTLQLDNNTGRLIYKGGAGSNYDQSSYVTVQINALRAMPENPMPEVRKPLQRTPKPVDAPKYQSLDQARECPLSPDVQHRPDAAVPDSPRAPTRAERITFSSWPANFGTNGAAGHKPHGGLVSVADAAADKRDSRPEISGTLGALSLQALGIVFGDIASARSTP